MSQRVPSWDLDDTSLSLPVSPGARRAAAGTGTVVPLLPMSDYGIAELTWANGHVTSHGMINKPVPKYGPLAAVGNCAGGGDRETLEAVVSEAATRSHPVHPLPAVPAWLGARMASAPADALVPCGREETEVAASQRRKRPRVVGGDGKVCASQASAAPGRDQSTLLTLEACGAGADDVCGFTTTTNNSTSLSAPLDQEDKGSPETENTSIGGGAHDSLCRSQGDGVCEEGEAAMAMRTCSVSTKRSRAAAVHNESERKRRDRINQKMKTLQKLVPNSSKTDKASMLDGVIDHLKQLQAQVQLMNRMSSMMMPIAMPQLHFSMMANMAQMAQMGLAMMNMGPMAQPAYACLTPPVPPLMHPPPFVPLSWDGSSAGDRGQQPPGMAAAVPEAFSAFLACQAAQNAQQPTSMEAYNRMVALYQTLNQQNQPTSSKH